MSIKLTTPSTKERITVQDLIEEATSIHELNERIRDEFCYIAEFEQITDNLVFVSKSLEKASDPKKVIETLGICSSMEQLLGVTVNKLTTKAATEGIGTKIADGFKAMIKRIKDLIMRIVNWIKDKLFSKKDEQIKSDLTSFKKELQNPEVKKELTTEKVKETVVNGSHLSDSTKQTVKGCFSTIGEAIDLLNFSAKTSEESDSRVTSSGIKASYSMEGMDEEYLRTKGIDVIDSIKGDVKLSGLGFLLRNTARTAKDCIDIVLGHMQDFKTACNANTVQAMNIALKGCNESCGDIIKKRDALESECKKYASTFSVQPDEGGTKLEKMGINSEADVELFIESLIEFTNTYISDVRPNIRNVAIYSDSLIGNVPVDSNDVELMKLRMQLIKRIAKFSSAIAQFGYKMQRDGDQAWALVNALKSKFGMK